MDVGISVTPEVGADIVDRDPDDVWWRGLPMDIGRGLAKQCSKEGEEAHRDLSLPAVVASFIPGSRTP